jgi:hypothetical protein
MVQLNRFIIRNAVIIIYWVLGLTSESHNRITLFNICIAYFGNGMYLILMLQQHNNERAIYKK